MNQIAEIETHGFTIINDVFSAQKIQQIISVVDNSGNINLNFRQDKSLFAIRNLLGEIPLLQTCLWVEKFAQIIDTILGPDYFVVRAIYFDKPPLSNWMVPWHQDLTIVVDRRKEVTGFRNWTIKNGANTVQPPFDYMNNIYTIRIHLDDCDETNGALKVIPASHKNILSTESINNAILDAPAICKVPSGGIMTMKPLLLHASGKSTTNKNRRVIHLEFSSRTLPNGLHWFEKNPVNLLHESACFEKG